MSSISFNHDSDESYFNFKPELEKINKVLNLIKTVGGAIGIIVTMPFIAAYFVLRLRVLKYQVKNHFNKLIKKLSTMDEREKLEVELRCSKAKQFLADKRIIALFKALKIMAGKNYFASRIYRQLEEIRDMSIKNIDTVTCIVYPVNLSINSPEFFENLKAEYGNQQCADWHDKAFDVYDKHC